MPGGRAQALKSEKEKFETMKKFFVTICQCYYDAFLRR